MCQILYNRAVDNGLRCLTATAKRLSPNPISFDHTISIQLSDGKKIDTQVLIDASGFSQWAARQLGIRQSRHYSICYGELLTNCTIEATSYFRFLAPNQHYGNGGGWFYPTGNDSVSFGYSIVTRNLQEKQNNLVKGYADAKQSFHPYANWLQESQRQRIEAGIIPVGRIDQFVDHRLVIIGDAGGQAYPWSVEGCRPALYNGRSCARAILAAFESNQFDRSKLAVFEKEWQKENRERFWRTASVADIIWSQSDEQWDKMIKKTQRLSPQRQLYTLRDNRASWLAKIYAVGGYVRRRFVNWLYQFKQKFVK
ncbi:MAG: hypothetical protein GWN62_19055 [Aliifodinibius sp.]|nr:hypothetical protein [Fodinibius sp.]